MPNTELNKNNFETEKSLFEIAKVLIDSKKLIILITLATTLLAFIYLAQKESKYESIVILEVGSYDLDTGKKNLIEPVSNLLKELKIELFYKQHFSERQIKLDSIEDKLLQITYNSPSPELNENLLKEVIKFVQDRHEVILNKMVNSISNKISYISKEINVLTQAAPVQKETLNNQVNVLNYLAANEKEALNNEINAIEYEIPILESKIAFLLELIPQEKENLAMLQSSLNQDALLRRASSSPTLQQLIYSYNIDVLDLKNQINDFKHQRSSLEAELKMIEANNVSSEMSLELIQERAIELKMIEANNVSSDRFLELIHEKNNLEFQVKLVKDARNKTQLIHKIKTVVVNKNELETILLFTIFGFIFSILIVLMREKYLKEWN